MTLSPRLQQAVSALEDERAATQAELDWLDRQIAEIRMRNGRPVEAPADEPAAPRRIVPPPRGGTRMADVVTAYLSDHPNSTAGEIADGTGLQRNSVSTLLTKLARSGALIKGERGYTVPD